MSPTRLSHLYHFSGAALLLVAIGGCGERAVEQSRDKGAAKGSVPSAATESSGRKYKPADELSQAELAKLPVSRGEGFRPAHDKRISVRLGRGSWVGLAESKELAVLIETPLLLNDEDSIVTAIKSARERKQIEHDAVLEVFSPAGEAVRVSDVNLLIKLASKAGIQKFSFGAAIAPRDNGDTKISLGGTPVMEVTAPPSPQPPPPLPPWRYVLIADDTGELGQTIVNQRSYNGPDGLQRAKVDFVSMLGPLIFDVKMWIEIDCDPNLRAGRFVELLTISDESLPKEDGSGSRRLNLPIYADLSPDAATLKEGVSR